MLTNKFLYAFSILLWGMSAICWGVSGLSPQKYHFYALAQLGYGTTAWNFLIANCEHIEEAIECDFVKSSALVDAENTHGPTGSIGLGYEINDNFALEGFYTKYQNTIIKFDKSSFYNKALDNQTQLISSTSSVIIHGKFLAPIGSRALRAFASVGLSLTKRSDILNNLAQIAPAFGTGLNYQNPHSQLMLEANLQYVAGRAETSIRPVTNYLPFLVSGNLKVGYFFF
jgi:hypothetical protein